MRFARKLARRLFPPNAPPIFYHRAYRFALPELQSAELLELRRADFVRSYLQAEKVIAKTTLRTPPRASLEELALVHDRDYLESLADVATLANIFAVSPAGVAVDSLLDSVRLATGGTIAATRLAIMRRGAALNLLGGFHHAGPRFGGGFCAVNDVAIALKLSRREGLKGTIAILDLDAHQPDGTAACLVAEPDVWLGSLSGDAFDALPNVDEVVVHDAGDAAYANALQKLLARMPKAALTFVLAGGDVLAGDRLGRVGLTLAGARARDRAVFAHLGATPSVWLPAGGYSKDSWRVLAGTALTLCDVDETVPAIDPLALRFEAVSRRISPRSLSFGAALDEDDEIDTQLSRRSLNPRLVGFYSASGLEYGLYRYGLLDYLERVGYHDFRIAILPSDDVGDRTTLHGRGADGVEQLLIDCVLERKRVDGIEVIYIQWLNLRHPLGHFTDNRPALPGQDVPGLGLAREMSELFERMADRIGVPGLAFRPAWFHAAFAARHRFRFADPKRQGRFLALVRDLASTPLREATNALVNQRVKIVADGEPEATYAWEPDVMLSTRALPTSDTPAIERVCDATHFIVSAA